MKKIGILFGQENTYPWAFVERVNSKKIPGIVAEPVSIEKVEQGNSGEYAVIIDRISQDVPFYRAFLKNAAISGTAVINNPFWWSADEKFFNNALALKLGVPVPNTVILPSKVRPDDTTENSFRNLKFPHAWDAVFEYIGFPAYMKPHAGGGWKSVYKIHNREDFFEKYAETEQLVMMLQSEVIFDEYFRCYCIGGKYVHIMPYEPRNPHHLRYVIDGPPTPPALLKKVHEYVLALNEGLGYDFNTVEFGVQNGIPYAIDFCNPAPDADIKSVGEANFEWVVETTANYAIERALAHQDGKMNLTWGSFIKTAINNNAVPQLFETQAHKKVQDNVQHVQEIKTTTTAPKEAIAKNEKVEKSEKKTSSVKAKIVGSVKDDLKRIEGIGPKIEELLNAAGIHTFAQLSTTDKSHLEDILNAGGKRFAIHNPSSWAQQAGLAAANKWDDLKKLQDVLVGGK